MDTDGSCTGEVVFSGCSGIFVGIEPDSNIVSICYTGSGAASGSGIYVSGQDNCDPNYPTYSASRVDGIVFGSGLKVTPRKVIILFSTYKFIIRSFLERQLFRQSLLFL